MAKYKILYKLVHANSALVDETRGEALMFEPGDGQLDPCLEACVKSSKIGQLQTFLLNADEAFGAIDERAIQTMKRSDFPQNMHLEIDAAVEFKTPTGDAYVGCITQINNDKIRVNFNHPLAGCDLSFQVEILEKTR